MISSPLIQVTENEETKMKGLNGACLFAYEIQFNLEAMRCEQGDLKSLPDIQRSILNGWF